MIIIIIIITMKTANPNWESLTPKTRRPGREERPVRKEKNIERIRKQQQKQITTVRDLFPFMNGNTERAYFVLSRVRISRKRERGNDN